MTTEASQQDRLNEAQATYDAACDNNAVIDMKIEAFNEVRRQIQNAKSCAELSRDTIFASSWESSWCGTTRDAYNSSVFELNRIGGGIVEELDALLEEVDNKIRSLRDAKTDLAPLEWLLVELRSMVEDIVDDIVL